MSLLSSMLTVPNLKHHYSQLPHTYPTPRVLGSSSYWSNQHLSSSYPSMSPVPPSMPNNSLPNGSQDGRLTMSGDGQTDQPSYPLNTHPRSSQPSPYLPTSSVPRSMLNNSLPNGSHTGSLNMSNDGQTGQPSYPANAHPLPTLSSPYLPTSPIPHSMPNNSIPNGSQAGRLIMSGDDQTDQPTYALNTHPQRTQDYFWSPTPNVFDADLSHGAAVQVRYDSEAWSYPPSDSLRGTSAYPGMQSYTRTSPSQIPTYPSQSPTYSGTSPTFSGQSPTYSGQSPTYSHPQPRTPINQISPAVSNEQVSPSYTAPSRFSTPTTPASASSFGSTSAVQVQPNSQPQITERRLYSHREQLIFFREVLSFPMSAGGPFVPQQIYKPHTNSDRKRYVEEIELEAPIYFSMGHPSEFGIPLSDALHSRVKRLQSRDQLVFEGRGPSVSIRLEWPGYRQWSRQIPTKDFRSPPGPITLAKLAKNVAKCVQRFIEERQNQSLEDESDARWKVGSGPNHIKLEDLILVSIHHVSLGSWQPHLRLNRQLSSPS